MSFKTKLKIAHFGAFNHDSFGDLLFPYIAEAYCKGLHLTHVSPTIQPTPWPDQKPVITTQMAFEINDWDGVLVGGGDLIQDLELSSWDEGGILSIGALQSLWCGASLFSSKLNIPCAWNSPGVPFEVSKLHKVYAKESIDCVDYLSVRDNKSAEHLGVDRNKLIVSPDSALVLSDIWKTKNISIQRKYVVISIHSSDLNLRFEEILELINNITNSKIFPSKIIVLPLMRWENTNYKNQFEDLKDKFDIHVLDQHLSLRECVNYIANAEAYIGNSLHGLITAVSYGIPAVLVKARGMSNLTKYDGFASHFPDIKLVTNNYNDGLDIISQKQIANISEKKLEVVENFNRINTCFNTTNEKSKASIYFTLQEEIASEKELQLIHGLDIHKYLTQLNEENKNLKRNISTTNIYRNKLEKNIVKLEEDKIDLIERIDKLEAKIVSQNTSINKLESDLQATINFYTDSKSWRITAPLRMIFKTFKDLSSIFFKLIKYRRAGKN